MAFQSIEAKGENSQNEQFLQLTHFSHSIQKLYSRSYEYRVIPNSKVNTKPVFSLLRMQNRMSYDYIGKPR